MNVTLRINGRLITDSETLTRQLSDRKSLKRMFRTLRALLPPKTRPSLIVNGIVITDEAVLKRLGSVRDPGRPRKLPGVTGDDLLTEYQTTHAELFQNFKGQEVRLTGEDKPSRVIFEIMADRHDCSRRTMEKWLAEARKRNTKRRSK